MYMKDRFSFLGTVFGGVDVLWYRELMGEVKAEEGLAAVLLFLRGIRGGGCVE